MDWFRDREDLQVLQRVRGIFKNQHYGSIEIWRLFGANVTLKYWEKRQNIKDNGCSFFLFFYFYFFRDFLQLFKHYFQTSINECNKNPVIIEALADDPRVSGFWLPVARVYKKESIIILTNDFNIAKKYQSEFNVMFLCRFSIFEWIKSRLFIISFLSKNIVFLHRNRKRFEPISLFELLNILIIQINTIVKTKWIINKVYPVAYLTIWDWYNLGSAAINTFKSYKILTFTFIHGAAGKEALKEFLPLNADYILSWGKHNTKSLIELGLHSSQILEVGCPRIVHKNSCENKFEEADKKIIIVLLTAILDPCFIDDIIQLSKKYAKDFDIHVRLHPSTNISELGNKLMKSQINIITKNDETLEQSLDKAFAIVVDTSTAGFDAINMDKAVFVIDSSPVKRKQDIMDDIIQFEAAIFSSSFDDFILNFEMFLNNSLFRKQLSEKRKLFSENFIAAYSDDSANLISKAISKLTC